MTRQPNNNFANQSCEACHKGALKVLDKELDDFIALHPDWMLKVRNKVMMLEREYDFKNYELAWAFTNKISELAESEFHHPSILLEWGKVTVCWWTHSVGGLHYNDFICVAKMDQLSE